MAIILGGVIAIYLISKLIGLLISSKVKDPWKIVISILVAYVISTIIASYGFANGGPPQFLYALKVYGISSAILLFFQMTYYLHKEEDRASGEASDDQSEK